MAKVYQDSPKVIACRLNGKKGGLARARNNTKKKMREWSSKGGSKTSDNHGVDFFAFIVKFRKRVGRNSKLVRNAVA